MAGRRPAGDPHFARIAELERRLEAALRVRRPHTTLAPSFDGTLKEWSEAVWAVAEALGPSALETSLVERGLELATRPVFVCGAARSGTTLLRDMLDGHAELAVVPIETLLYTSLERTLAGTRADRHCAYLGRRWLEGLASVPPGWLLGSSSAQGSPYVAFARDFSAWWRVSNFHRAARHPSWPMAAMALAFAQYLGAGAIPAQVRMWVEKTPANELHLDRIWRDFPDARVLHIVREPHAVLASLKAHVPNRWSHRAAVRHCLRYLLRSYRIAAAGSRSLPSDRYCLIRYEDLTAQPDAALARIAAFLGIALTASLRRPTVAGRPATNNSSFGTERPSVRDSLTNAEKFMLALTVGRASAELGYRPGGSEWPAPSVIAGR